MDYKYIFFNAVMAAVLFYLNGILGRIQYNNQGIFKYGSFSFRKNEKADFRGNFFLKIVNPTIFVSVIAAIAQFKGKNDMIMFLWQVIPFYWLYRLIFMMFRNSFAFMNNKFEFLACVYSLFLGEGVFFSIIRPLVINGEPIFIPLSSLRDGLWFAIIAYILKTMWDILKKSFSTSNLYSDEFRHEIIQTRYKKFKNRYGKVITDEIYAICAEYSNFNFRKEITNLVYSIMIYEDYNRPVMIRMLEYIVKIFVPWRELSLGIMQVQSLRIISSRESIIISIQRIAKSYMASDCPDPFRSAIQEYNNDQNYLDEVEAIFNAL